MILHRYMLRPGRENMLNLFVDGTLEHTFNNGSIIRISVDSPTSDIDYLDNNIFICPFLTEILDKSKYNADDAQFIEEYNAFCDNLVWLIRREDLELNVPVEVESKMSLYELNQQMYANLPLPTKKDMIQFNLLTKKFIKQFVSPYYMLLCRELNDYTIFHRNYSALRLEDALYNILRDRGTILDIRGDEADLHYLECWVRFKGDDTPHMYIFFDAEDFIIEC